MKHTIASRLHLWLSVPFGLIIVIICLSGAVLVFERGFQAGSRCEIKQHGEETMPLGTIMATVNDALDDGSHITCITSYSNPEYAYKVALNHHSEGALWVNQYTGEIIGEYERPEIFKIASSAHRRLFDKTRAGGGRTLIGKMIVGVTTIVFILILITGIIVWWPTSRHEWKLRLSIPLRRGLFPFLHGLHCAGGMYVTIVLLICCITGLTWSFKWYNSAFYTVLGADADKRSSHTTPAVNFEAWQKAFESVSAENPGKEIRVYEGEIDVVRVGLGTQYAYDNYSYDGKNGKIIKVTPYEAQSRAKKIKGWINTLHFGTWGGWPVKILYFLIALIGAMLPLTGYYLWIRRLQGKAHNHHIHNHRG